MKMAKNRVVVTDTYQTVATGAVVITVAVEGTGTLFFDETGNDATAYKTQLGPGEQFQQTDAVDTQVKSDGSGWEIIVDGVL